MQDSSVHQSLLQFVLILLYVFPYYTDIVC